jgi:hypothetical protein
MLLPYIIRRKQRHKFRRSRSFLNVHSSSGFFPFYQAHYANHFESELAGGFDCLDRRAAGGANVVNDHDAGTFFAEAFNALPSSMLLLGLANEKSVQQTAGHSNGNDDRISTHC